MSVDRTLHIKSGVASKRNVLKRPERIAVLREEGEFDDASSPLGLRKTRVRVSKAGTKGKKEEKPAVAAEPAAEAAKEAPKPAKAAKGRDKEK